MEPVYHREIEGSMIGYDHYEDCWFFYNLHLVHYCGFGLCFFRSCRNLSMPNRRTNAVFSGNLRRRSAHLPHPMVSRSSTPGGRNEISLIDSRCLHSTAQYKTVLRTENSSKRNYTPHAHSEPIWPRPSKSLSPLFIRNARLVNAT